MEFSIEELKEVMKKWNLNFSKIRPNINIDGSPQRNNFRVIIEDNKENLYLIENIFKGKYDHKLLIAKTIFKLKNDLLLNPFLLSKNNKLIEKIKNEYWQISKYVSNTKLKRPDYVFEKQRAKPITNFLLKLKKINYDFPDKKVFYLSDYTKETLNIIKKHNLDVYNKIKDLKDNVQEFLDKEKNLPVRFCHGDYHPMNILWDNKKIKTVIDWEFLGYKIESYDLANMIGCLGIENPKSLVEDLVINIIKILKKEDYMTETSWKYLIDTIVALRFGWLSEWLRFDLPEMITLEIKYINLLIKNKKNISELWFD